MNLLRAIALSGLLSLGAGLLVLSVPVTPVAAQNGEVRIQTRLAGGAVNGVVPSGSARFRSRGGHSNFSVEVEDLNLADGTVLSVSINGRAAGTLRLTARGGEIDVNTKDGDTVPAAVAGETVTVSGPGGAILSGVLR